MNLPNIKDILKKLSVFRNNLSLLIPIIIMLVAILLFIPTKLMSSRLKEKTTKSVSIGKRVKSEIENTVANEGWKVVQEQQREHAKDADEVVLLAQQSTQRELLSYDIFLDPNITSALVFQRFGQRYRDAVDEMILEVNGGDRPTQIEIERGLEDSAVNSRMRRGRAGMERSTLGRSSVGRSAIGPAARPQMRSPGRGSVGSLYGDSSIRSELESMIIGEICQERAKSISIYVNPSDMIGYDFWGEYKLDVKMEDGVSDCWYFQLANWVIEDIFDTIGVMNSNYDNVLTSPVKQFVQLSFTMGLKKPGSRGGGVFTGRRQNKSTERENVDKPFYVRTADEGLSKPCTGRVSGDDIDVIHFSFTAVLDRREILSFMKQLCSAKEHKFKGFTGTEPEQTFKHNQITILESEFRAIDNQSYSFYRYGQDPVVEVDFVCEYIFNKKGYDEIMPESVKETLAEEPETTRRRRR
jgi:hypothetical protein